MGGNQLLSAISFLISCLISFSCAGQIYDTKNLKIEKIRENVFQHISFLKTENFGDVPCNGMIYFDGKETIVFDTPVNSQASEELIDWIEKEKDQKIKAVVVTHFHIDCLGGLAVFHERGIASYAHELTVKLAAEKGEVLPQHKFKSELQLSCGDENTLIKHFGKGHTADNVVAYIPSQNVLFGGCLIKEIGAGKGNLADASPLEWSQTVQKIKNAYPEVELVIPGHGKPGDAQLLDYTLDLFE
ncbi:BcII family subclass B1 metallo-beta-lactamase [Actinomadura fibrosa]